mgnify:CR=1 FL=1
MSAARLAGAMRLGEMAHRLETRIEHLLARAPFDAADVETLQSYGDGLRTTFEALREHFHIAHATIQIEGDDCAAGDCGEQVHAQAHDHDHHHHH